MYSKVWDRRKNEIYQYTVLGRHCMQHGSHSQAEKDKRTWNSKTWKDTTQWLQLHKISLWVCGDQISPISSIGILKEIHPNRSLQSTSLLLHGLSSPLGFIRKRWPTQNKYYPQPLVPALVSKRNKSSLSCWEGPSVRAIWQVESRENAWDEWNMMMI